jgi:fibronectin-binding autotransporter adhesin
MKKLLVTLLFSVAAAPTQAANITRANVNTNNIATATNAWSGSVVPGAGDVAVWSGTIATTAATNALGSDVSWQGIMVSNIQRAITIKALGTETLTLGTAGIDMTQATNNLTINPNVALGASQTWAVSNGRTLTVTGVVSGDATKTLTKNDLGTLTLSGTNTYAGRTILNNGILMANNDSALGSGLLIMAGGTLSNSVSVTLTNSINLSSDGLFGVASTRTNTLSGVITNTGGLTKTGAGVLNLSGTNNTFGGQVQINEGTVLVSTIKNAGLASSLGTNATIRMGSGTTTGALTLVSGTSSTDRRIQIGNGSSSTDTGGATINANGIISFTNSVFSVFNVADTTAGASRILTLGGTNTTTSTISGAIADNRNDSSGRVALVKTGAGRWTLSGTNTYSGGTTVNAGTLYITKDENLGARPDTVIADSLKLTGAGALVLNADMTLSSNRGITVSTDGAISAASTKTAEYAGIIAGAGDLRSSGGGRLKLTGTNSSFTGKFWGYSGGSTEVSSLANQGVSSSIGAGNLIHLGNSGLVGTLDYRGDGDSTDRQVLIGNGTATNHTGGAIIRNNGTGALAFTALNFNFATNNAGATRALTLGGSNTGDNIISGIITDNRDDSTGRVALVKADAGKWILSGDNTYGGGTILSNGVLVANHNNALGSGLLTMAGGTLSNSTGNTLANNINLSSSGTFGVNSDKTLTISGVITNTGGLTKTGSGTLKITGNNTYKGTTAVTAGKLIIDGDQTNATGALTVSLGAALGGSGKIGGNTTIAGLHTPGNSPGIQTFAGNLTYEDGASVVWELARNTMMQESPAVFDQIIIDGNLNFTGLTKLSLAFDVDSGTVDWSNAFWDSNQSWIIYDVAGTTTGFSNLSITNEVWRDSKLATFSSIRASASFSLTQEGNDIKLNYVVPEPTAISLLGLAGIMMLVGRRLRFVRR